MLCKKDSISFLFNLTTFSEKAIKLTNFKFFFVFPKVYIFRHISASIKVNLAIFLRFLAFSIVSSFGEQNLTQFNTAILDNNYQHNGDETNLWEKTSSHFQNAVCLRRFENRVATISELSDDGHGVFVKRRLQKDIKIIDNLFIDLICANQKEH